MAYEVPVAFNGQLPAHVDLLTPFLAVYQNGTNGLDLQVTAGNSILGVLQAGVKAGRPGVVMTEGVTKWTAVGAINPGAAVYCDGAGKATASSAGNNVVVGRMADPVAASAGAVCSVELIPS